MKSKDKEQLAIEYAKEYTKRMDENPDLHVGIFYDALNGFLTGVDAGIALAEEWISVEDELPECGESVLVKCEEFNCPIVGEYYEDGWMNVASDTVYPDEDEMTVTHWRYINRK